MCDEHKVQTAIWDKGEKFERFEGEENTEIQTLRYPEWSRLRKGGWLPSEIDNCWIREGKCASKIKSSSRKWMYKLPGYSI